MTAALRHRGPDGGAVSVVAAAQPVVVLGHRRLAIIDLSADAGQPMADPATGSVISFNGEIYNYRELRERLRALGCSFRTNSDTEVLLKAHATWGDDAVRHLNGIFAYALWDAHGQRLLLVRDHLGVKPMYFAEANGRLVFASEVRAVLESGLVARRADVAGIRSYLSYGSVQDPLTVVAGLRSLMPGTLAVWSSGHLRESTYWAFPPAPPPTAATAAPLESIDDLRDELKAAVKRQMVSDVPLGAFLSGGIDSTAIAALMKLSGTSDIRTFSIVFDEDRYDERTFSRLAAARLGTNHTELLLRGSDVQEVLVKALSSVDQPSVDGLNTYFVAGLTKRAGLTVAMSGLGGDELFGGYDAYHHVRRAAAWHRRLQHLPRFARPTLAAALRATKMPSLARAADLAVSQNSYDVARQLFGAAASRQLLDRAVADASEQWRTDVQRHLHEQTVGMDDVSGASALEMLTYMPNTLLRDTDQMSMAHALEVRVPLIDYALVEHVFSLPGAWRVQGDIPKPLLTRPLLDIIPRECIFRPKRGFELPLAIWLRDALRPEMESQLLGQSATTAWPFTPAALDRAWKAFQTDSLSWSRIWSLFMLREWMHRSRVSG
jgi:asparagine synthase (glutamine-hydrolysing)